VTEPAWFVPLRGKPKVRELCAFDVEGRGGPGGFVCGAVVSAAGSEFYLDPEAMFESLLEHGARGEWVFAHNLEYDLPIVAGAALLDGDLLFKHEGMLWATYHVGARKARFYDSLNLFPRMRVKALGQLCGRGKLEVGQDVLSGLSGSATWSDLSEGRQSEVRAYCTRDAEIVLLAVEALQAVLLGLGGELHPTIAGCAMDLYRRTFHKWPWQALGEATNGIARGAFYGGRTEAFMLGRIQPVSMYDTNSLYPYVQETARFPFPGALRLETDLQGISTLEGAEGVAQALLTLPEAYVPTLPHRFCGRLFFPVGSMEGVWTIAELLAAQARGAIIHAVRWALYSRKLFNPFAAFVEELWRRRQGYLASDDGRAAIVKLLLNSLYGRFGMNPEGGLWRIFPLALDPGAGETAGFVTSEVNGIPVMAGQVPSGRQPAYVNVLIAAQVAAAARLHLLSALEGQDDRLVYCDTDSIITTGELPTSEALGGWRLQMGQGSADIVSPKEYVLHNATMGERAVAKGVPERLAAEYLRTGQARFQRALSVRESLAHNLQPSEWVEVLRQRREVIPKRCPALAEDPATASLTLTVPWEVSELAELLPAQPKGQGHAWLALALKRREGSVARIASLS